MLGLLITTVLIAIVTSDGRRLIYEEELVTIHSGISMESTIQAISQVTTTLEQMEKIELEPDLLGKLNNPVSNTWDLLKKATIKRIKGKLEMIERKLTNIFEGNTKNEEIKFRRSIDFIGNIISYISGVPSPGEWRLNVQNVGNLKKAMELLLKTGNAQEARIDITNHHIAMLHTALVEITAELNKTTNLIYNLQEGLESRLIFSIAEQGLLNSVDIMEEVLYGVDKIFEKGRHNMAAKEGLSTDFLKKSIRHIQDKYKILSPLFGTQELSNYYDTALTTVTVHDREIWVTLKIPMVNFNNKFIRDTSIINWEENVDKLVALDVVNPVLYTATMNHHTIIGESKLASCMSTKKIILCDGKRVIIGSRFTHEGNVIDNYWAETSKEEHLAFINLKNLTIQITCQKEIKNIQIGTKGLIYLRPGCTLKGENIVLENTHSTGTFISRKTQQYKIINIIDKGNNKSNEYHHQLNRLEEIINNLNVNTKADEVNDTLLKDEIKNDGKTVEETLGGVIIHQGMLYGGISTTLIILLALGITIILLVKKLRNGRGNTIMIDSSRLDLPRNVNEMENINMTGATGNADPSTTSDNKFRNGYGKV